MVLCSANLERNGAVSALDDLSVPRPSGTDLSQLRLILAEHRKKVAPPALSLAGFTKEPHIYLTPCAKHDISLLQALAANTFG